MGKKAKNFLTGVLLIAVCAFAGTELDGPVTLENTPTPSAAPDSILVKLGNSEIGVWPYTAIADSIARRDTMGHGAIKQSIRDTAANKLSLHGTADSANGSKYLGGKTKAYYDTVGSGADRNRANHTGTQAQSTVVGLVDSLTAHRTAIAKSDTAGHGAIKKSIIDTAANKLSLHGTADSANGSKYLGGKTKAYYDTVGNGGMNAAIALKLNISDTSIFSRDGHGHDTGDLSGLPNFDYFVQGSSSTRTTDAANTDVDSYTQSGFYRASSAAPNLPTAAGYGIIHTNHASTPSAFQLASGWSSSGLYYRAKTSGTWEPWLMIYHSGNFNPADYTLTTDPRLSDARTPTAHAATHLYNGGDAIVGNEGFGLRAVATNDVWSVGGGLEYGGIGIISNWGNWRQAITFTDAGADSHPVFSIITSKNNGSTWSNVFNVTSSGSGNFVGDITAASMHVGTNEVWHAGNFNPADYTTTAQLQDWSTDILVNQLESYNAAEFTTVYNDYCDNIRLVKKGLTSLQNGYAGSIAFGARGANTRHAAIAAKQTGSDANQVGLAFFTHPQTSILTTYPMVEKMVLDHNGTLSVGGDLIVGDKLTLAVDGSGHATVSTKDYGDDIKIKTGGNGSVIDMKDLSTSISSRDVTVSSSYQTKVKSGGTVNIEGGSGITLDCTGSNSVITANKRMTVKRLNYGEKQNIYLTSVDDVHWIDADTLTSSYLNIDFIHDSLHQYGIGQFGIKNAKIGDVFIIEMSNRYTGNIRFWWKYDISYPPATPAIPFWYRNTWVSVMAICMRNGVGSTGQGDYGSEFNVFTTNSGYN